MYTGNPHRTSHAKFQPDRPINLGDGDLSKFPKTSGICQGPIHWLRENTSGGLMSFSNNCIFFFKTSLEVQFFADITMCPIEPHTQFFSSITSQKNAIENCFYFCGVFVFAKGLCTDSAQTRLGFSCLKKKFVKTLLKLYEKFQIFYSSWVKAFSHW